MKKTTLLTILLSIFVIISWIFIILFIQKNHLSIVMTNFSMNTIKSFNNSVSYILCYDDYILKNVKFEACEKYFDGVIDDMKILREEMWITADYNYIGK